ncbi:helix-turn-helix domain-containing protein [Chloroflexota bacterium]
MKIRELGTGNWFFVHNVIIDTYGPLVGSDGIAVYTALCRHADVKTQTCFPSHKTLAREAGLSVTTVKKQLRKLKQFGLVHVAHRKREDGPQTSNLYTLLDPPRREATTPRRQATTPQACGDYPPVASDTPPPYRQATTNNTNKEQDSMNNLPPDGGEVGASDLDEFVEEIDLKPETDLQRNACIAFNGNGSFASRTQQKQFVALEREYPAAYLEGRMRWAADPDEFKGFKRFVSAVRNPANFERWKANRKGKTRYESTDEEKTSGTKEDSYLEQLKEIGLVS